MRIAVIGGSAAGIFTSLLLARAGHEVLLFERDALEPMADVESAAASAFRKTAPQIVHPHIVLARCRELIHERLPDVYDDLLSAGVAEAALPMQMPEPLADKTPRPGDERFTSLMTRRSTFDWVLRRAIAAQPGVDVHFGVRVTGFRAVTGKPPHVSGVRTQKGDVSADLVVDASGYRTPIDNWLREIGAGPTATRRAECGVAYFSRYFRLRPQATLPGPPTTRIIARLDEFTAGIWGADNGTMQMAVAPLAKDHRFRTVARPEVFTAVLRTIPVFSAWLDVMNPISEIFIMGAVQNTLRRLVVDHAPVTTGLHTVGDSVCTTNPTLGRGLSMAISDATDLVDTIDKFGDNRVERILATDELALKHVVPFYEDQASIDAARLATLKHTIFDAPAPDPAPVAPDRITFDELNAAAQFDPTAFRGLRKIFGMLCRPDDVYTDPDVVERTHETIRERGAAPRIAQPTRQELVAALAT